MLQSYIDVVVAGALRESTAFAKMLITTTFGWHGEAPVIAHTPRDSRRKCSDLCVCYCLLRTGDKSIRDDDTATWWVNDRKRPAYTRASDSALAQAAKVDDLLRKHVPTALEKRVAVATSAATNA